MVSLGYYKKNLQSPVESISSLLWAMKEEYDETETTWLGAIGK